MDTDTHDALLSAILANPDADLPRLVYADFLEENDGLTGVCEECNGVAKITDRERHGFIGNCPPLWWHTAIYDGMNRVTYCRYCQGSGKGSNRFAERAEFIRLMCDLSSPAVVHRIRELHNRNHYLWFPTGLESSLYKLSSGNPSHVVTRGFISEVRCDIGWWVGGTCGVCGGTGHSFGELWGSQNTCAYCGGTGGAVANGPTVVKSHPVTRVTLTDKMPTETPSGWAWTSDGGLDDTDVLPGEVFDRLDFADSDCWYDSAGERLTFLSLPAANSALSNALLVWAKLKRSE